MSTKVTQTLTSEQALHIGKNIVNFNHLSDDAIILHVGTLINDGMYTQSNLHGREWFQIFEYLKEQGYDLTVYRKQKYTGWKQTEYYDEFTERWSKEYGYLGNGDRFHDLANDYAESKIKDSSLNVEDFEPEHELEED